MGEMISFPSNGHEATGYLATPETVSGPGVIVIQEWWGINNHIKDVCDRFAAQGFVALAPDLYNGRVVAEPDEAAKAMMALQLPEASKQMTGAVKELVKRSGRDGVGVVGFCMGGGLAYLLAADQPELVKALVPFYGVIPWPNAEPDYARIQAPIQGHYAEHDDPSSPEVVRQLEERLRSMGKSVEFFIYPGTEHAFFNDDRPEVYHAQSAMQAWDRATQFLRDALGS
ncbi:MAG: dienelactone hydrolase family protein [Ferrimicrobium sp.]|jgi:carboxymethylenebutenolidase|nr:dienelactone hydrolase family protein [Ferrimicrobium sp.]